MSYADLKLKCAQAVTGTNITAAPTDATTTAKLFELIKDDSVDVQSQIINYQSLSDSHLNNNVENLVLPLRSVF